MTVPEFDSSIAPDARDDQSPGTAAPTRFQKIWQIAGWSLFGLICLMVFTLFKLPEEPIKNYIQDSISNVLAPQGITMTAGKTSISMIFGPAYKMKDITLTLPPPSPPAHIDEIRVYPSVLSLLIGRIGAKVQVYNGDGQFTTVFSLKGAKGASQEVSGWFKARNMDLGKIGVLPIVAGVRGSAIVSGNGTISGDINSPATLNGNISLDLSKITIEQQSIQGFSIPRLAITEGKMDLALERSKGTLNTFTIGKREILNDDIHATVTGDLLLGKQWDSTTLNTKVSFRFSDNVLKSMPLLDALLTGGKQVDNSYLYALSGPALSPAFSPVTPTK